MKELVDVFDARGNKTGLTIERGRKLAPGQYRMAVHAYIVNPKGEFLISKRAPEKSFPNMWEGPGGAVSSGETGLQAAIREAREELGVILDPKGGKFFKRIILNNIIHDQWIFKSDADINEIKLQPGETSDAIWASKKHILRLIKERKFLGAGIIQEIFGYLNL